MRSLFLLRSATLVAAALVVSMLAPLSARGPSGDELEAVLSLAGARVEQFFTRAQSLVCTETVAIQPLTQSLRPDGVGRTVESELRLAWQPDPDAAATEARTWRQVLKVNGRPPRRNDRNACTGPEQEASETQPLSMLLPVERQKYGFSLVGSARLDGRDVTMVDFKEVARASADVRAVAGLEDCISYEVTGGQHGRLWIDRDTADVLRLDQFLGGVLDLRMPPVLARRPGTAAYLTLERSDTSIRFGRVPFRDPEESIVLPLSSTELRITRGAGTPRLRTVITYSGYKRFLTEGRLLGSGASVP